MKKAGKREDYNDTKFQRPKMTEEDWENKFNYCLEHFLVNVQSDFYDEEIQFKHPDDISEKFSELEEQNLFIIHARQEIEQAFEELKSEEKIMKRELSLKLKGYENNLKKLEDAQTDVQDIFNKHKLMEEGKFRKQPTKNHEGEEEANISELLDVLRSHICKTYKKVKNENSDLSAKNNIDMLSEIESSLDTQITYLNEVREEREAEVK